jgi:hypothetical protein
MRHLWSLALPYLSAPDYRSFERRPARSDRSPSIAFLFFEVADTGIGSAPEAQSIVFRSFEQSPDIASLRGGCGLGLTIAKGKVEHMGGTIGGQSAVGQGSRFWFEVPLRTVPEDNPQPPEYGLGVALLSEDPTAGNGRAPQPVTFPLTRRSIIGVSVVAACQQNDAAFVAIVGEGVFKPLLRDFWLAELAGFAHEHVLEGEDISRIKINSEHQFSLAHSRVTRPVLCGHAVRADLRDLREGISRQRL